VFERDEVYGAFDDLIVAGKVRHYGVSVERIDEALTAIEHPNVKTVQIVYNIFRQRPAEGFFSIAKERRIGVLARLPLSSGMLAGKMTTETKFSEDDHRLFNREGAAFDRGETFSGVDYATGLRAVEELRPLVPGGVSMASWALRWCLMEEAVSCVIPGGRRPSQVEDNVKAASLPPLSRETMAKVRDVYDRLIRPLVHEKW
jgi:aryl-alcohol dehydrogenase-like predicted oxidoreductase